MKLHRKILKILVFTVAASILLLFIAIDIIKFAITERVRRVLSIRILLMNGLTVH